MRSLLDTDKRAGYFIQSYLRDSVLQVREARFGSLLRVTQLSVRPEVLTAVHALLFCLHLLLTPSEPQLPGTSGKAGSALWQGWLVPAVLSLPCGMANFSAGHVTRGGY